MGAINADFRASCPLVSITRRSSIPRPFWKHVYEPIIRHAAGLGKAPTDRDSDTYEHFHAFFDVMVVGGGIAGLAAAQSAVKRVRKVLLVEQTADWGGRAVVDMPASTECLRRSGSNIRAST